ncbi:collagen alpha-1(I) chain-like [Hemicordylus capensis]|uniref:collagen alpha-1(I) chain-like n=1 Tax=Hemicordylus capensis TaxID=884348 RepID=UPI00230225F4|nr:collagen alpha-1(I) chain-like [Hemicordylus capensis]
MGNLDGKEVARRECDSREQRKPATHPPPALPCCCGTPCQPRTGLLLPRLVVRQALCQGPSACKKLGEDSPTLTTMGGAQSTDTRRGSKPRGSPKGPAAEAWEQDPGQADAFPGRDIPGRRGVILPPACLALPALPPASNGRGGGGEGGGAPSLPGGIKGLLLLLSGSILGGTTGDSQLPRRLPEQPTTTWPSGAAALPSRPGELCPPARPPSPTAPGLSRAAQFPRQRQLVGSSERRLLCSRPPPQDGDHDGDVHQASGQFLHQPQQQHLQLDPAAAARGRWRHVGGPPSRTTGLPRLGQVYGGHRGDALREIQMSPPAPAHRPPGCWLPAAPGSRRCRRGAAARFALLCGETDSEQQ